MAHWGEHGKKQQARKRGPGAKGTSAMIRLATAFIQTISWVNGNRESKSDLSALNQKAR